MEKVLMVLLLLALAGCTDYVPEPVPYKTGDRLDIYRGGYGHEGV